jgi:autotransporter-associated beta strand protein
MTFLNSRRSKFAAIIFAAILFFLPTARLEAVINGTGDGTGNNSAPTDALGDPGWANVGSGPYSNVYLGNGWVLEAYHCHVLAGGNDYATINGQTYTGIAGSGFQLTDPNTHAGADLYMYRINGNPALNSIAITASTPTTLDTLRAIGNGRYRVTGSTPTLWDASWNVLPPGSPNPPHSGYYYATPAAYTKHWGDNQLVGNPITHAASLYTQTDWAYGPTQWFSTKFDASGVANEYQAADGDSGGGVFVKNSSGYWQLTGILDAVYSQIPTGNAAVFPDPNNSSNYDATYAANLSYYRSQIVSAVQVFQISGPLLTNPSAAMGTLWQSVRLIGNGGFGASTGLWSLPVDTNGYTFTVDSGAGSVGFQSAAVISGSGGLTKNGTGTLTLFSANTFTGPTNVTAGTLLLNNAAALQNSTLNYTTGTLIFNTGISEFTFGGLSGSKAFSLKNLANAAIALSVGKNNQTTSFSGAIDGGGSLTKIGTGTLTLSGANSYTGPTKLSAGTLIFSQGALGTTSQVIFTANSALQWNGHNQALSGRLTINDGVTATLDTNGNNVSFSQPLNFGTTKTGSLVKSGGGVLTIAGPMSFAGNTTVSGGTLALGTLQTPGATVSVFGAGSLLTATSITADTLRIGGTGAASSFSLATGSPSVATVPEPTALTLLLLGLLSLGAARWRYRH